MEDSQDSSSQFIKNRHGRHKTCGATKNKSSNKIKKSNNLTKKKIQKQMSSGQKYEQSQEMQQQIVQIRHHDESTKQHIRPQFLKRWDGSNELTLTEEQLLEMPPMVQNYWRVKCKNMNVLIFVQFGKVQYLAFENDAIILHEMFKKNVFKFSRFLTAKLFSRELQLAKVTLFQRHVPMMVMKEMEDVEYRMVHGILRREVQEVITPGLHIGFKHSDTSLRLTLVLFTLSHANSPIHGVLVLDSQANRIQIHSVRDKCQLYQLRRLLTRFRPVEVVLTKEGKNIVPMIKQICHPYIVQFNYKFKPLVQVVKRIQLANPSLAKAVQAIAQQEREAGYRCADLLYEYLETLELREKIFDEGIISVDRKKPFFDAQTYENLEVFRLTNGEIDGQKGTLLAYLDRCCTAQGRKLLRRWIDQPLSNMFEIKRRQEALKQILQAQTQSSNILFSIKQQLLPFASLETDLAQIYHWVLRPSQQGKQILTASMTFDKEYKSNRNPAVMRLKHLLSTLNKMKDCQIFFSSFQKYHFQSPLLLFPLSDISPIFQSQLNKFEEDYPVFGVSEVFDAERNQIDKINKELEQELRKWRDLFQNERIIYVSVRAKNEIQIPKGASIKQSNIQMKKETKRGSKQTNRGSKTHAQLMFSSQTSTAIRYTTAKSYALSESLKEHEQQLSKAYEPILNSMVQEFCKHKDKWEEYVQAISLLDVVTALVTVALEIPDERCLAQFIEESITPATKDECQNKDAILLQIVRGAHVGLLQVKEEVVRNSMSLCGSTRALLLTGPNMGGKSSFLKQTCLLAILAQMGAYLPCAVYRGIVFDQIFCRMGASDRILEGKSTFYVELEETKRIVEQATSYSLVMIDELGRGTSTYDGIAIAQATLEYLLHQSRPCIFFSTHYTQIASTFASHPAVVLKKLGYTLSTSTSGLQFTYQIQSGVADRSFANHVAQIVGIPSSILTKAQQQADIMNIATQKQKSTLLTNKMQSIIDLFLSS